MDTYPTKHDLYFHRQAVAELCRVCGNRAQTKHEKKAKKQLKSCQQHRGEIREFFGITVQEDEDRDLYPQNICTPCCQKLQNAKRKADKSTKYGDVQSAACEVNERWRDVKRTGNTEDCTVCSQLLKKGRKRKVQRGRPKIIPDDLPFKHREDDLFSSLLCNTSPAGMVDTSTLSMEFVELSPQETSLYTCPICTKVFTQDCVKSKCHPREHYFCTKCLSQVFKRDLSGDIPCPVCNENINFKDVLPTDWTFRRQLSLLKVKCSQCSHVTNAGNAKDHACMPAAMQSTPNKDQTEGSPPRAQVENISPVKSWRDDAAQPGPSTSAGTSMVSCATSPMVPLQPTLEDSLMKPVDLPPNQIEEQLYTSLTRRKLKFAGDKHVIRCKTRGQPIILQRLRKARNPSAESSLSSHRKRVRQLHTARRIVAGGVGDSLDRQHSMELKVLCKEKRERICSLAGVQQRLRASRRCSLAFKTHIGLTWNQMRKQKRLLKQLGVELESEHKVRQTRQEIMGEHLKGEMKEFTCKSETAPDSIGGFIKRNAPFVYIDSLPTFLRELLDKYQKNSMLTWLDGALPEGEIWVKIGGDHGGNSFKMCLQVVNLHEPNAKKNTIVFAIAEAKDYICNLTRILQRFDDQFQTISTMKWQDKSIRLFVYGDYDFLRKLIGISGAQGTHPCIWCLIKKCDLKVDRKTRGLKQKRKLSQIKLDYANFARDGKVKSKAALHHNVITKPVLNVMVKQICPPYLHILLGIVKKSHDLLEKATHKIDIEIAEDMAKSKESLGDTVFEKYVKQRRDVLHLTDKRHALSQQLESLEENEDVPLSAIRQEQTLKKKVAEIDHKLQSKEYTSNLDLLSGPVTANLDSTLQKCGIKLQAYHSRSFVGNHCNRYLQPHIYTAVCDSVVDKTKELSQRSLLINRACAVAEDFKGLFKRFSNVHLLVSHGKPIKDNEVEAIQKKIDGYLGYYRRHFPEESTTPKMHFLEDHTVEWISQWHMGMAAHGEQGGESVHKEFNKLDRIMAGIREPLKKMLASMGEHIVATDPNLHREVPQIQKRLRKS